MNTNKMIKPKNRQCRTRLSKLANRFIHTMNREKRASMIRMTSSGTPVQIRVLDSRSYFFMTASTSSAVPTSTLGSPAGAVLTLRSSKSPIILLLSRIVLTPPLADKAVRTADTRTRWRPPSFFQTVRSN